MGDQAVTVEADVALAGTRGRAHPHTHFAHRGCITSFRCVVINFANPCQSSGNNRSMVGRNRTSSGTTGERRMQSELVGWTANDAPGACGRKVVKVQILSSAPPKPRVAEQLADRGSSRSLFFLKSVGNALTKNP